jgi:hypothetical protein
VDSGCTGHFLLVNVPCLNKVKSRNPLTVRLPNGATMESSHTADLDIPELNSSASKAHVFPGMAHHSFLSVGQLCDEGYIVTFQQDTVTICNSKNSKLLSGPRDETTSLWRINLKQTNKHIPDPIANNVYELRNTGALVHVISSQRRTSDHLARPDVRHHQQAFETDAGNHRIQTWAPRATSCTQS